LCLTNAPDGFDFIPMGDRSFVIEGAVDTVPRAHFEAAARECPERAIIIED
jgi:ferredoxin